MSPTGHDILLGSFEILMRDTNLLSLFPELEYWGLSI